jgi:hypothetical protein
VTLLGPADADHFRVKVGRYGDRWYADPLPDCPIAKATDAVWPSISTVKKASGSDWSFVALKRVAAALEQDADRLRGLDYGARYDALKSINQRGLGSAAQRGTNIHLYCEAKLRGYTNVLIADGDPGTNYFPAVDDFFDKYQPELVAAEYVVVDRTLNEVGYGGTPDAIVRIDGGLYAIDWKSRGEDSEHGAYAEEGAQIGAGAHAEYMIVEGDAGPERCDMPKLDGGLVISIKHDGCRVYPVDLDKAFGHFQNMHSWWCARRTERDSVGKPWAPKKSGLPTLSPAQFEVAQNIAATSAPVDLTPTPADQHAALNTAPDEGGPGDAGGFLALETQFKALDDGPRKWVTELVRDAQRANVSFHSQGNQTVRRFELIRALTLLAPSQPDDETMRALLATVLGDVAWFPSVTVGHLVGSLSAWDAATFAGRCDLLVNNDTVECAINPDGRPVFRFAA